MKNLVLMCAKCRKPVDEFVETRNLRELSTEYVARCHGEEERVTLTKADQANALSITLRGAFIKMEEIER